MLELEPTADYFGCLSAASSYEEGLRIIQEQVKTRFTQDTIDKAQIVVATVILTLAFKQILSAARGLIKYMSNPKVNLSLTLFNIVLWLPCGRRYLQNQEKKLREDFKRRVVSARKGQVYKLPDQPWKEETIMNRIKTGSVEASKFYKNGGKLSGGVYSAREDHWDFISDAMRQNIESNPLHVVEFTNVTQLEAEIIRMTLDLFNAPSEACGLTTSGGTESIMLAMLAYRQWGAAKGITKPNVVASVTVHAAFDKACFYFGLELRKVQMTKDHQTDLAGMRACIDRNTVCIVASAPEYAFGMYDPVPQIAAMATEYGINCHSDCCLGSYINPFTEEAGFKLPCTFDFKLEGVTTLSCDPHKFCYGPKGCSVILFRTKELRRHSWFAIPTWPGGMYLTPTLAGSRSGAVITGTWAALMKQGRSGFLERARSLLSAARNMREDIKKIPELQLVSDHDTICVSFTSKIVNCVALNDLMVKNHKWTLNTIQYPLSSHLVVTDANATYYKEFAPALKDCVAFLLAHPEENNRGDAALYGMSEKIPNKTIIGDMVGIYLEAVLDAL